MSRNSPTSEGAREGSLEAPTRHALEWKDPKFYDQEALFKELERVFDICHGCRRCVSLCNSFPTLFDLVDGSQTMEVDGVATSDYWKVVDHCYLCDLCYLTKCPYVPPHAWNVDFPHLMLRAKAVKFKQGEVRMRDRILTSTDAVGKLASIPVVSTIVNAANKNPSVRKLMDKAIGVHPEAPVPEYHSDTARKRLGKHVPKVSTPEPAAGTTGKVVLFTTCYGNYNQPQIVQDMVQVLEHNGLHVKLAGDEQCCGMPKLELGDLEEVDRLKRHNVPLLAGWVREGYDVIGPIPSCILMFKQELPLMYPNDADVALVKSRTFDPFEYLMLRHKEGKLNTDFKNSLGKIMYHAACHLRVQNVGLKTRDLLKMVPGTTIDLSERCSGHDGTYAVKTEFHDISKKICRPIATKLNGSEADHYSSDCPMAATQIGHVAGAAEEPKHPFTLLKMAYGL